MERIEEEMIYIHSISIVCVENCRLIHGFNDSEVILVTSFSLLSKPILDLFQIQWAFHWMHFTELVPLRISVLITLWIISVLILRHRTVREMMEDQFMISICMDMKGMWNGLWSSPIASFPDPSILWLYPIGSYKPVYSPHCHLHFLSHPVATYPIELNRVSLLINARDTNPCCSPTIFRIYRERAVDPSLFSSPFEWWGRS